MPLQEIEQLYAVFSRYPHPRRVEGCPCCTSPSEAEKLATTPLRSLSPSELEHYAAKALTTWGTLNDYKYFLPRILELTHEGRLLCDLEITFGKLSYGRFSEWPGDEQDAVRAFIARLWQGAVGTDDVFHADSILCGSAAVLDDVTPLLNQADSLNPKFRSLFAAENSNQTKRKLLNSFWDRRSVNYQRVLAWLYPV